MALTDHRNAPESSLLLNPIQQDHNDNAPRQQFQQADLWANTNGDVFKAPVDKSTAEPKKEASSHTVLTDMDTDMPLQDLPSQLSPEDPPEDPPPNQDNDGENNDDLVFAENCCTQRVEAVQKTMYACLAPWRRFLVTGLKVVLVLGYFAYFLYCMARHYGDEGSKVMLALTLFVLVIVLVRRVPRRWTQVLLVKFTQGWGGSAGFQRVKRWAAWIIPCMLLVAFAVFVGLSVVPDNPENLQSLLGLLGFPAFLLFFSKFPARVNWWTVVNSIILQLCLAVFILRASTGLLVFDWLGSQVESFLSMALEGAKFVFGEDYIRHRLAMVVVPVMVFFNAVIYVLFHYGVIQGVISSFGRLLAFCLHTGPIESFSASSNVFVSLTEAPMMLRPFLKDMTRSELHTVMTCGFASISGSVLGTYVQFKIEAKHLLTASVLSAPAALAISKLMYPETKKSWLRDVNYSKVTMSERYNTFLEAAASGARNAIPMAAATLANQIAFVSMLAFLDSLLAWFAARGGFEGVSFKLLCSYIFYPLVLAMGTAPRDSRALGGLLGIKLFGTPIMSYTALGSLRSNRLDFQRYRLDHPNATWSWSGEDIQLHLTNATLAGGVISERSEVIATYMLCGFSTITSIGICLGVLVPMAEERKKDITRMVVNSLVAGNFASFLTAAVAGLMFKGSPLPT